MPPQVQELWEWVSTDPVGRAVGLAVATLVGLFVLIQLLRTLRWAAARWKELAGIAILLAALFYGAMVVLQLGPVAWAVSGAVALGMFFGIALFLTQSGPN